MGVEPCDWAVTMKVKDTAVIRLPEETESVEVWGPEGNKFQVSSQKADQVRRWVDSTRGLEENNKGTGLSMFRGIADGEPLPRQCVGDNVLLAPDVLQL